MARVIILILVTYSLSCSKFYINMTKNRRKYATLVFKASDKIREYKIDYYW